MGVQLRYIRKMQSKTTPSMNTIPKIAVKTETAD